MGGDFLAPMIGISMIKELGPLLTAIIISGRNGSSTTAEIATMVVGEEIDALKTMGLNPIQFVVVPKFWAMTLTHAFSEPCATVVGITSSIVVAVFYLGIYVIAFVGELLKSVALIDVVENIIKSVVFSWLIIWVGAFHGFKSQGRRGGGRPGNNGERGDRHFYRDCGRCHLFVYFLTRIHAIKRIYLILLKKKFY